MQKIFYSTMNVYARPLRCSSKNKDVSVVAQAVKQVSNEKATFVVNAGMDRQHADGGGKTPNLYLSS